MVVPPHLLNIEEIATDAVRAASDERKISNEK